MTTDTWIAVGSALISLAFYAGGFFFLTRNHIKHLTMDIKSVRVGQKRQDRRIERIETVMMNWTGGRLPRRSR